MKSKLTRLATVFFIAVFTLGLLAGCVDTSAPEAMTAPETTQPITTAPETTQPMTTEPEGPATTATEPVQTTEISSAFPLTITDQKGRTVTIETEPHRVISLAPSNTEILFAIGLGDRVVGRTDYCNYPPEVEAIPSIGGFSTPNLEQVVALEPDLVLATSIHEEIVSQLEALGIPTVILAPEAIDGILGIIEVVGRITGAEEAADELLTNMRNRIEAVSAKIEGLGPEDIVRSCFVVWHDPLMLAGGDTIYEELIRIAGGSNIVSDQSGYPSIDLEQVVLADPQVIIVGVGMGSGEDLPFQYLLEEPLLEGVSARQNDRVYAIDQDIVGRFGPRIVDALEQFAVFMHPELFD
jgi:iron complex transport system substrate-binding protein